ncbi:MAG: flavin reductase [Kiritimatiellaeota bacterium]|nr:flavin reductase [Kiritimatiellota bacterium]
MNKFKAIPVTAIADNPFKLIGTDWMLITAGTPAAFNTMTASWGGLGMLWDKQVAFIFVRPTRHTFGFLEKAPVFTLSFFTADHRAKLEFCGTHSGRSVNKVAKTGLTPLGDRPGVVYFAEARLVLVCRKIYFQDLDPARFLDPAIAEFYGARDYHRLYIGEVTECLSR